MELQYKYNLLTNLKSIQDMTGDFSQLENIDQQFAWKKLNGITKLKWNLKIIFFLLMLNTARNWIVYNVVMMMDIPIFIIVVK
jgi:hypothetical protein